MLGRFLESRVGPFTTRELASLELDGLSHWLADRLAEAKIVLDPDPLGLGLASPSTSSTGRATLGPSAAPGFTSGTGPGIPTPFLPTLVAP